MCWREPVVFPVLATVVVAALLLVLAGGATAQPAENRAPQAAPASPASSQPTGTETAPATAETAAPEATAADAGVPAESPAAAMAPDLTPEQLSSLVSLLEDDAARKAFVEKLKALEASRDAVAAEESPADPAAGLLDSISGRIKSASVLLVEAVEIVQDAQDFFLSLDEIAIDQQQIDRWSQRFAAIAIVLGLAFALQWLASLALRRSRRRLRGQSSERLGVRIALLVVLAVIDLLPIAVFAAAAYVATPLAQPDFLTGRILLFLTTGHVLAQATLVGVRAALAPESPGLRVLAVTDDGAVNLYRASRFVVLLGFYGFYILKAVYPIGLPTNVYLILLRGLGLVIAVSLIGIIIGRRAAVARWLRGEPDGDPETLWRLVRRRVAGVWHLVAILYVVAVFVVWSSGVAGALPFMVRGTVLSIVLLLAASVVSVSISRTIVGAISGKEDEPGRRLLMIVRRLVDVLVYALAALLILEAWDVDSIEWLGSEQGRRIVGSLATIFLVVAGTFAISEVLGAVIERYLAASDRSGTAVERSARARTLLPLARKALLLLLIVLAAFIILSELGIDVAPLIAGAGVVGIAIGFGAQSLVKDVISGFFILLENTMAVGDVVDIDGNAGLVEAISVRTVVLRDLAGTVHTIPFGSVARIKNLTKDFSFYVADIGVAYREDVDRVIEVIREVGEDLREDPAFRPVIIAPLEVLGVDQFADSAVIIKVRLKTRPIQQWNVGREFNRRLKKRFDAEGIEIPYPHRTLYFGVDRSGAAAPANIRLSGDDRRATAPEPDRPGPALRAEVEDAAE